MTKTLRCQYGLNEVQHHRNIHLARYLFFRGVGNYIELMHYLYKTLNHNDYFRHFASLETNPDSPKGLSEKITRFLYRSSCLFLSFHHLKTSLSDSVELAFQFVQQLKFNNENRIAFSCSELFMGYAQIPAALSALVLMQNELLRIIPLISGSGKDLPKSLNRVFEKGVKTYGFSHEIEELLIQYWKNGGKYIRDLRNINEHYDILVNHTFFEFKNNRGRILIFLPDNPESRSPRKFTFKKELNANDVIHKAMTDMNNLVADICELHGFRKGNFRPHCISKTVYTFNYDRETTMNLMISLEEVKDNRKVLHAMEMKYNGKGVKGEPYISWEPIKLDKDVK